MARPFEIVWFNASVSEAYLGPDFEKILATLRFAEVEDARVDVQVDKFRLHLIAGPVEFVAKDAP